MESQNKKTFMSRSVVFNESVMFYDSLTSDHIHDNFDKELQHISVQMEHVDDEEGVQVQQHVQMHQHVHDDTGVQVEPPVDDQENEAVDNEAHDDVQHLTPVLQLDEDLPIATRKSKRGCGRPHHLTEECNMIYYALSSVEQVDSSYESTTYSEAIACSDREKWNAAMHNEMQSLEKNCTWDVVPLPKGKKHVRCKWIYKKKEGLSLSEPPKYKGKLVAKGFSQIPGVDYNDVFSPVVKHGQYTLSLVLLLHMILSLSS
jgi:hypothetical protein